MLIFVLPEFVVFVSASTHSALLSDDDLCFPSSSAFTKSPRWLLLLPLPIRGEDFPLGGVSADKGGCC